jgi:hypothetical protein|tara:strand:- start:280 stop:816 length:537 start_codon:yes stop_codon:yes gene_type:complete
MTETSISEIKLEKTKEEFSSDDNITINVRFSIKGDLRESFTEKNWTEAYERNDNTFKLKYGIKLQKEGFRKQDIGKNIDTYRKASIFWTRNPKLVNPMKEKRIWVQVAKNFEPFIRLTEEEVRQELFDFSEEFHFKASELGKGKHKIGAEAFVSWQTHEFIEKGESKSQAEGIEITIN